jgi:hypothetical protein
MISKKTTQISIGIFTYKTGEDQSKQTCKRHRKELQNLYAKKHGVDVGE